MGKLKTFEIVFENNKIVYYPGQEVRGKCVLELKGELKLTEIKMFMRGVAKVHWTESRSTGNRLGAYTEHYNAEIEYFFKKQILCESGQCSLYAELFLLLPFICQQTQRLVHKVSHNSSCLFRAFNKTE